MLVWQQFYYTVHSICSRKCFFFFLFRITVRVSRFGKAPDKNSWIVNEIINSVVRLLFFCRCAILSPYSTSVKYFDSPVKNLWNFRRALMSIGRAFASLCHCQIVADKTSPNFFLSLFVYWKCQHESNRKKSAQAWKKVKIFRSSEIFVLKTHNHQVVEIGIVPKKKNLMFNTEE